jgi:hypothetical protein
MGVDDLERVFLRHGSLEFGRHRDIDRFGTVYAVDSDPPILHMLRAETQNLSAAGHGLKSEFHDKPRWVPPGQ